MKLHLIGLGKMGKNMALRLLRAGHEIKAFDTNSQSFSEIEAEKGKCFQKFELLIDKKEKNKIIWLMVPSGEITQRTLEKVLEYTSAGDIIVDGGNSNYKMSQLNAKMCKAQGVFFLDCGTSGGIWGLKEGYCLMVGGEKEAFDHLEPIFKGLAQKDGYLHVGPSGSGHYTKMIHNGVEYAMMQAYAEGFELMKSHTEFEIDPEKVAHLWRHGSVVRSWLLDLLENAFAKDPELASMSSYIEDSGEGRWTVNDAVEQAVPAPTITAALFERFRSRQEHTFSNRVLAALRKEFGGHVASASNK